MKYLTALIGIIVMMAVQVASAEELGMPSISGSVTFLYYEDLAAPAEFYGDTLGLAKSYDIGWVHIYDIAPGASVGIVESGRGFHEMADDKPVMLSIVTEDVDAWFAKLSETGTEVISPLAEETQEGEDRPPVRGFIVLDPGGYTVEFFEWQER